MITEEPPFIAVGTDVSAKFKGAFCEATVKATKKLVKCKVLLKSGSFCFSNDENIDGPLKLNSLVKVKQQDNEYAEGTIVKLTDNSQYTVVFDDGDEKTLRRTSLCLKGERHFQEDENLDNRPLNNPENFGAPVSRQRTEKSRKRPRISSHNSSFDEDETDELALTTAKKKRESSFGKVFCVELGERRKSWFPALCLHKGYAEALLVKKDQMLIQSFKDGKRISVNKNDVKAFSKDKEPLLSYMRGDIKIDPILRAAIERALMYYDHGELPRGWQVDLTENAPSSSDEEESVDEEIKPTPDEDMFLSKLYALMEEQGTPITKPPILGYKPINLYKLYQIVMKNGGMDEVTNLAKWRSIYVEMGLTNPPTTASYNIRNFYKRYLYPYEELERATDMTPPTTKNSETAKETVKEKAKKAESKKSESDSDTDTHTKRLTRMQSKNESDSEVEKRETRSSKPRRSPVDLPFEPVKSARRLASSAESSDESTSSSVDLDTMLKRDESSVDSDQAKNSEGDELVDIVNSPQSSVLSEKDFSDAKSEGEITMTEDGRYPIGAKILVKYGKGKTHRAYEAKVMAMDMDLTPDVFYFVHYRGWNHRYDEWIKHDIITGLSPTPFKKKNGGSSKNSPSSSKYKHDMPPGGHGHRLSSPSSAKQRGSSPSLSARQTTYSPSCSKHGGSSPSSRQRASSPPSRQTSRSNPRRSSPPPMPLQPSPTPAPPIEKPAKSPSPTTPKPTPSSSKSQSAPLKISSAPVKSVTTPPKPAHVSPKPATLSKSAYTAPKVETPFVEAKNHPVKPRTTRNSMQDVFLITALEESISAKGGNGRRKNSPSHGPDSPSSEGAAPHRLRRARDKHNQSPIPEEEQSDSSSAKEDDVEIPEQNRTPQQKKPNRRKRKDRSPFEKTDSKESAEDDESVSEYRTQAWRERKNSPIGKIESKTKSLEKRREKTKGARGRPSNARSKLPEVKIENIDDSMEVGDILGVPGFGGSDELPDDEPIERSDDPVKHVEEVSMVVERGAKESERGAKRRKGERKGQTGKHAKGKSNKSDALNKKDDNPAEELSTAGSNPPDEYEREGKDCKDKKPTNIDKVKGESENNDDQQSLSAELASNAEEIIGMERVVDILQQAAAINAEKERNLETIMSMGSDVKSSPSSHASTGERKKKRKERKRRKRTVSCTFPDVSESDNGQQSPVKLNRPQSSPFGKEKFDFVSDLGELSNLGASERIRVIQSRIHEIQKIYGKIKTELASIERRRRRKLRKQGETALLVKVHEGGDSRTTIPRL